MIIFFFKKVSSFSFSTMLSKEKRLEHFGLIKLSSFISKGRNETREFFEQKKDFELASSLKEAISLFRFGKKNFVERDYQC